MHSLFKLPTYRSVFTASFKQIKSCAILSNTATKSNNNSVCNSINYTIVNRYISFSRNPQSATPRPSERDLTPTELLPKTLPYIFRDPKSIFIEDNKMSDDKHAEENKLDPNVNIGFIGGGAMASAMINGLLHSRSTSSKNLWSSDVSEAKLYDHKIKGVHTTHDNILLVKQCNIIVLSVKPHIVPLVLKQIQPYFTDNHLIISIAAGVTIHTIESELVPIKARVVRVMPNTPALVGASAAGYCMGNYATNNDSKVVQIIFGSMGKCVQLQEKDIDAVTGLSGSGPAYVFMFIEALADGGVRAGLTRDVAMQLAAQTVFGAAKMVLQTGKHPGALKDQVASPGGTTIAGIHALENSNFRAAAMNAVVAATNRSTELGVKAMQLKQEEELKKQQQQQQLPAKL